MPDFARYPRPLLWVGLVFVAMGVFLDATRWGVPDEALRGTAVFWWSRQLGGLIYLLFRCGSAALAAAAIAVIAATVTARCGAKD